MRGLVSQRRACHLVGIHRSVARHQPGQGNEPALRARLRELAAAFPRYGYKLLHELLKREGLVVNAKKTYRLYREEHLQVRRKRRNRLPARDRVPLPSLDGPNQRWSMDFMSDQLATGRRVRILNVVDDYSRECIGQLVDVSISGERVSRLLERLADERARPAAIVVDNGPEFTSKALFVWAQRMGVRLRFIQPGKPCQNAFVESFNGKFRDACLNEQWFVDLAEARHRIEAWRIHYNTVRPHSALGFLSPEQFRLARPHTPDTTGRVAGSEQPANGPLSPNHPGGYNSGISSLSPWT